MSLVPSATETLIAWDRTPLACTRFCEQPTLAHVGGTKNPDIAAIAALEPDLVVVDREENRLEDYAALIDAGLTVHVLEIRSLADVDPAMSGLAERVDATWDPIGPIPAVAPRLRAAVPIWRRPWMWLAEPTYGTSLLAALGVANVVVGQGPYPSIEIEDVAALDADLLLAPSEPYEFSEKHRAELESVAPVRFIDGKDLVWWGVRTRDALERLTAELA